MSMNVTDIEWFDQRFGKFRKGYYMDEFLAINMMGVPDYLKKSWDVVGIISGHSKVRIGKSTLAAQLGYMIAWSIAGGEMVREESTGRWRVSKVPVKGKITFSLDNLVFSPKDLMKKAAFLYEKYGRNQVIIYDEGRAGLDSARAMEQVNKAMQDFFQECGMYGHVILIVLPNYFKLHEDYAVSRSLFLIDVFANQQLQRGFFNFYNEKQKEWLYFMGKKKIGTTNKYAGVKPSFSGRFTQFLPFDKEKYEEEKRKALKAKQVTVKEKAWKKQRDAAIYLIKRNSGWSDPTIARELTVLSGESVTDNQVKHAIENIIHKDPESVFGKETE